jgi:hypothetical protein
LPFVWQCADPSVHQNWAVCVAAQFGRYELLKLFLQEKRVNHAAQENDAVKDAASDGHCDVLELLLADSRVDGTGAIPSALFRAVHILLEDELRE